MATTASFKQQCPSCEAWVPIRDSNLIGRKIDCPKCKYRFVVEEPAADEEEEAEPVEEAQGAARGGRRRRDEDDEDSGKPKKAGAGMSQQMIIGIALGAVALV